MDTQTTPAPDSGVFEITRTFTALRDLVFAAWTEPVRVAAWFGPVGVTTELVRFELRVGGQEHYSMSTPHGEVWRGIATFTEIDPPQRLCYINSFADAEFNPVRPPFADSWPLQWQNEVRFEEVEAGTRQILRSWPINACASEQAAFVAGFEDMRHGWGGSLDQLEAYLLSA
ncbi:MAG: SRPBCC domain-containing protein [bacterium]|nr:SRPBCC domain-containing protein [bacterium]